MFALVHQFEIEWITIATTTVSKALSSSYKSNWYLFPLLHLHKLIYHCFLFGTVYWLTYCLGSKSLLYLLAHRRKGLVIPKERFSPDRFKEVNISRQISSFLFQYSLSSHPRRCNDDSIQTTTISTSIIIIIITEDEKNNRHSDLTNLYIACDGIVCTTNGFLSKDVSRRRKWIIFFHFIHFNC